MSLSIDGKYKGLKDQTFDFSYSEENIIAFIGLNGSGKSQLLELIVEVFSYLERYTREDFKARKKLGFGFHIVYDRHAGQERIDINIDKGGAIASQVTDFDGNLIYAECAFTDLPDYVIGYSSGLNENVQRAFMKNVNAWYELMQVKSRRQEELSGRINEAETAKINQKYLKKYPEIFSVPADPSWSEIEEGFLSLRESEAKPSMMLYMDYDSNLLLAASLALLEKDELDKLFPALRFRYPTRFVIRYDIRSYPAEQESIYDIQKLSRLAHHGVIKPFSNRTTDEQFDLYGIEYLRADIDFDLSDDFERRHVADAFINDPIRLFSSLVKLQQLGVRHWGGANRTNLRRDDFFGTVKKPLKARLPLSIQELYLSDGNGNEISIDDLSDGEAQLFTVLGMARLFRDSNALFVLDEPETHLNPAWRTEFHKQLADTLDCRNEVGSPQLFVSTHSPFLVSALRKDQVYEFSRSDNSSMEMNPLSSQTFGASFDVLIKRYFGLHSTISQTAVKEIKEKIEDLPSEEAIRWLEENMGDSMEKAYLLRKLSE